VNSEYGKWGSGEIVGLERDPDINDVLKYWPKENEHKKPLSGITVEFLQHINLLYSHRNYLIHELRTPGYGIDSYNEDYPYYISFSHISDDHSEDIETWELTYPVLFLKNLVSICLSNMKQYLIENNIDPYVSYTFGTYWIDELNR
jgi:hypothetical protein